MPAQSSSAPISLPPISSLTSPASAAHRQLASLAGWSSDRPASPASQAADAAVAAILTNLPRAASHSPPTPAAAATAASHDAALASSSNAQPAPPTLNPIPYYNGKLPKPKGPSAEASPAAQPVVPSSRRDKPPNVCTSCGTTQTPLWRRDPLGKTICNACGAFARKLQSPRSRYPSD